MTGIYPELDFCNAHACRYARWVKHLATVKRELTADELAELRRLMWLDRDMPMFSDWRLARDHEAPFVYAVAAYFLGVPDAIDADHYGYEDEDD